MLKKITLRNFKSFRDSIFELGPLTLMVGANASGKSNFVDALRFLQGCARGLTLGEIFSGKWEGGQLVWMPIRGGEQESFGLIEKAKRFELEMHWELPNLEKTYNGNYCLEIGFCETKIAVLKESFTVADEEYIGPDVPEVGEDICANLFAIEVFTVKQKKFKKA